MDETVIEGSGNVFEDIGLSDAKRLLEVANVIADLRRLADHLDQTFFMRHRSETEAAR